MQPLKYLDVALEPSGVAIVHLNRPPVNAVSQEMYLEISRLFSDPDAIGPDLRAIVLAAHGPHFCAGNDLGEFATLSPENGKERQWQVREAFFAIQDCAVPGIAAQPIVRRMYFTGEPMRAADLAAAGGAVFIRGEGEDLLDAARRFALRAASFSPTATRLAKQILNRIETMNIREGYEFEQRYTVKMSGHPDSKEALKAFAERRPASYAPRDPSWTIKV